MKLMIGQAVGLLAGVWLMAAPAVVGYVETSAGDMHRVVGPMIAALAIVAFSEVTAGVRWPNVALGVALVGAPLLVGHDAGSAVVGISTGAAVVAATPFAGASSKRFGGGWSALTRPDES